ncbi:hypothetical protein [Stenotrophomonas muris]|uniref:hypothetical protein n=1 Tax=Stenotrophomonas muris TaxID=2963283 RepID=UPI002E77418B|nr:hypothetical protein [Stenotrophomonas muris]
MTDGISELLDRVHSCEVAIEVHRGYLKAMEYALRVTVLTHPAPEQLTETWTQLLPSIVAKHRGDGGELFAAAFEQSLRLLTEQIGDAHP